MSSSAPPAAFESLQALASDPKHLGARIGAIAVLHTWTRTPLTCPLCHTGLLRIVARLSSAEAKAYAVTSTQEPIAARSRAPP